MKTFKRAGTIILYVEGFARSCIIHASSFFKQKLDSTWSNWWIKYKIPVLCVYNTLLCVQYEHTKLYWKVRKLLQANIIFYVKKTWEASCKKRFVFPNLFKNIPLFWKL